MGKYLEIADKALLDMAERRKQSAIPTNPSTRYSEKSEVSELSHDDRFRLLAGPDWPEIFANPDQLEAFKAAAETAEQIRHGEVPAHYTATTTCKHCGPVPIFQGCPSQVLGCPWCFSRMRDVKVPA